MRAGSSVRMAATTTAFNTAKSEQVFSEAKGLMPGGVSSPVRAFKSVGGEPVVFDRVKGAYCWDVDDNKYIDYVGTWGPAICGHANDEVNDELRKTLEKGTSFGAPSVNENVLAKAVIDAVPSVEMVRFTNSGTEACMGMLRLVRAYTKRDKIIKFEGCYHGHADGFLVQVCAPLSRARCGLPRQARALRHASRAARAPRVRVRRRAAVSRRSACRTRRVCRRAQQRRRWLRSTMTSRASRRSSRSTSARPSSSSLSSATRASSRRPRSFSRCVRRECAAVRAAATR